jgi:mannose-6-phosphate isomerase-like protein (cupin superfamily)
MIVLSGACRVIFDHIQVDLGVADSIYFWAAETHRYEPLEPDTRILSIVIDPFPSPPAGLRLTRRG